MLLRCGLYKTQRCCVLLIYNKLVPIKCATQKWESNYTVLLDVDSIDNFTTQLVQRKAANWEIKQAQLNLVKNKVSNGNVFLPTSTSNLQFNTLTMKELDNCFKDAIESFNISMLQYLTQKCTQSNKLPSEAIMFQVLSSLSVEGDQKSISDIINLCEKLYPSTLKAHSGFVYYLAEATWVKGNINEAVTTFERVYRTSSHLRRKIRFMLKNLISAVITSHGEAALVTLIGLAERIAKDFNDFIPLMYIYKVCFLSEWHSDQCLALDLLRRHAGLAEVLSSKFTYIVILALRNNQTEIVYRLLEVLLALKRKSCYAKVLELLFDHRVYQGDLRGCVAIMEWAIQHDVHLSALRQQKFIKLLVLKAGSNIRSTEVEKFIVSSTKLNYKF